MCTNKSVDTEVRIDSLDATYSRTENDHCHGGKKTYISCLSAVCPGGPMLHESDKKAASESSCQKYLGVVIIDRLQIVYIK